MDTYIDEVRVIEQSLRDRGNDDILMDIVRIVHGRDVLSGDVVYPTTIEKLDRIAELVKRRL